MIHLGTSLTACTEAFALIRSLEEDFLKAYMNSLALVLVGVWLWPANSEPYY